MAVEGSAEAAGAGICTDLPVTADAQRGAFDGSRYLPGSVIAGKYQLSQVIGQGGMGSVWLAKNRTLDLEVAVKVMRAELADDIDGIAERMLQEARAAASVGHPAIIQVFDFGFTERGDPYIAMELLQGESLAHAIRRRGRLGATRAVQTLLPIVDALVATHARGIVHRDLKPENIFLARPSGRRLQPKVLDFGIAKLEQQAAQRLTRGGAVIGSPAYMSPEQLRGESDVDARADIWSLAVVLYQMLTGQRPFEGSSYHASLHNVLHADPHPLTEHGITQPKLWPIVQRALSKDRDARHENMLAFGRDLAHWLISEDVHVDIGDASLEAWMFDTDPKGLPFRSFFPSTQPGTEDSVETSAIRSLGDEPETPTPEAAPGSDLEHKHWLEQRIVRKPVVVQGVRGVVAAPASSSGPDSGLSSRAWMLVTALCVVLSFGGTAVWAVQTSSRSLDPSFQKADHSLTAGSARGRLDLAMPRVHGPKSAALGSARLHFAPLPKTGPRAPLLYIDSPPPLPRRDGHDVSDEARR